MKIETTKTHLILIPESESECFDLGNIGTRLDYSLWLTSEVGGKAEVTKMQIPLKSIYDFILSKTRKHKLECCQ
ncbi:hypothetical protein LCGC14_2041600 [marine sediment metagenome]|uniref:Uncharacterized protein n=1 Tax=marine sediment metagenome TaxID=412755 RepID=A0A0F9HNT3_9ZZZZ